ncbi:LRR receptor-like serine/threonine-protein kinase RPK2 [Mercurialis annua]|uniref:LRR receptor-like serine/threonine-protein kinase RPK2 n=1 Tax=Mercurialis annua TaxID=3986 RepID=UPI002160AD93|nr:LRR receptor-like serine/threonine-protein kinase RPK2 [Mercurialis annua]
MKRFGFPEAILFCFCCSIVYGSGDKAALLEFKSLVSDPHGILSTWNSSSDHCSWYGVSCNSQSRVVSISISGGHDSDEGNDNSLPFSCSESLRFPFHRFGIRRNCSDNLVGKLQGKLTPLIGKLSELRVLSLVFHKFSGEIPLEIWGLENLEVLDLEGNLFTGELPCDGFVRLRKLRVLNLGFNRLYGEIPSSLSKCVDLEVLNLSGNKLKGSIPMLFGRFSRLRKVYLANNELNGTVPVVLGSKCAYLEHLDLSGNFLIGEIPSTLGDCRQLRTLLLFSNMLNGEIPRDLGQLRKLQVLDISRNFIGGMIPAELGNCVDLSVLVLSNLFDAWLNERNVSGKIPHLLHSGNDDGHNQFQGFLPKEITTLPKLRVLWAPMAFSGGRLPSQWGDCTSLEMVNLALNGFNGEINGIFEKCRKIHHLDLSSNRLSGELDEKLPVPYMTLFDVSQNFMSGTIPRFSNCSARSRVTSLHSGLGRIYDPSSAYVSFFEYKTRKEHHLPFPVANLAIIHSFGGNRFTGSIRWLPVARQRLGKPVDYAFLASGNKLTGSFSRSFFGKCSELHGMIINVSKNQICGPIPHNIGSICRSLKFLDASNNRISGSIPQSLGNLKFLVTLNLSGNKLQGQIPASLYQLEHLKHISLNGNNLTNAFPSGFRQPDSPEAVRLSENSFYVKLFERNSSGASNMRLLSSISTSSQNMSEPVFLNDETGNDGDDQLGNVTSASESQLETGKGDKGFKPIEIASIACVSAILSVLVALVIIFFYTRKWGQNTRIEVSEPKEVTVFANIGVPLSYENIVEATGNFNASNCIGNGGFGATYKAEISQGILVAIKKLAVGRCHGVQQFHNEIKALGSLRHRNLVTLIGYHASDSEMFLIYNYLPGGNLEDFIKERSPSAVCWKVLHKIALHIASALAYLHCQCAPRVLHRDVKPSNILLDNELNAYLSDFGLSRLLGTSETHATTGVAGTFGYVAPEYAMTCRVSEKADVYSYGVVLLELISDKKALDPSFSSHENGFNIVSWACMLLRHGQAKDVFTAGLWDSGPQDDLVEVLHLAVKCTVETLSTRPNMKQVVQQLKQIQPP